MAKTTPAQILYPAYNEAGALLETVDQSRIDFHAVIAEAHSVAAEITKYPVQTGFHVSNNSIRQNRVVTIDGIITNTSLAYDGTEQNYGTAIEEGSNYQGKYRNYGIKATNSLFQEMEELVINGTDCRVITNLGEYLPVVFNKFNTKQMEGMVDSMKFTLSGEEVFQVDASTEGGSVPLTFTELTGAERDAELQKLAAEGIPVEGCSKLSTATVPLGQDFHVDEVDDSGQTVTTKYRYVDTDSTTGEAQYEVIADEKTAIQENPSAGWRTIPEGLVDPCKEESVGSSIANTAMQALDCFVDEATEIVTEFVVGEIDSAIGKLGNDLTDLFYDTVGFGSGTTSALASAGIGCLARSITGSNNPGDFNPGESLPTGQEIFDGITDPAPETVTITQIICDCPAEETTSTDQTIIPPI